MSLNPPPPPPPNPPNPPKSRAYWPTTALLLVIVFLVLLAGGLVNSDKMVTKYPYIFPTMWGVVAAGMIAFLLVLGADLGLGTFGVLVNERNLMSLARFQLVAWTILVCSAFVTIGVARVIAGVDDPLGITVPAQLWQILGISAASTVGASLVLKNKTNKEPADPAAEAIKVATVSKDTTPQEVLENRKGLAYGNPKPQDARITDMFEGDELANTAYIDMSKVQMFFFTLIALIAYAVNIGQYMVDNTPETLNTFPALSPGLVAILGISHAAYLGNKSVDKTKTA